MAAAAMSESSKQGITTEQLLRPLNVFTWVEDPASKSRPGSIKRKGGSAEVKNILNVHLQFSSDELAMINCLLKL